MPHEDRPAQLVYRIGDRAASILELLRRFAEPETKDDAVRPANDPRSMAVLS